MKFNEKLLEKLTKFLITTNNFNKSKKTCGAYGTRTRDPMRDRHVF